MRGLREFSELFRLFYFEEVGQNLAPLFLTIISAGHSCFDFYSTLSGNYKLESDHSHVDSYYFRGNHKFWTIIFSLQALTYLRDLC